MDTNPFSLENLKGFSEELEDALEQAIASYHSDNYDATKVRKLLVEITISQDQRDASFFEILHRITVKLPPPLATKSSAVRKADKLHLIAIEQKPLFTEPTVLTGGKP